MVSDAAMQYLKDCCTGRLCCYHVVPNSDGNGIIAKNLDTGEFELVRVNV